jgi:hypothetical protein
MERRAVVLRRDVRAGCFKAVPFGCRAVSQRKEYLRFYLNLAMDEEDDKNAA